MTNYRILPVRLEEKLYKQLHKLAYLTESSMADIIRQGIKLKLEEYKKVLTNSDIAI